MDHNYSLGMEFSNRDGIQHKRRSYDKISRKGNSTMSEREGLFTSTNATLTDVTTDQKQSSRGQGDGSIRDVFACAGRSKDSCILGARRPEL